MIQEGKLRIVAAVIGEEFIGAAGNSNVEATMSNRSNLHHCAKIFQPQPSMPTKAYANATHGIEIEMASGIIAAMPTGTQRGDVTVCLDIAAKFGA